MATAYAALGSLMQIIEQTQQHPSPPISLDPTQVNDLTQKISFLQEFLERYSDRTGRNELDGLESGIADAAHEAADIIESAIVNRILDVSTSHQQNFDLFEGIRRVFHDVESRLKGLEEIGTSRAQPQPGVRPPNLQRPEHNIMVGLDDELKEIMGQIASHSPDRLILPIVGMAGIGKTTLARNVFSHPLIHEHFDIRAWTTVSLEYSTLEILRELHSQFKIKGSRGDSTEKSVDEHDLGLGLHQFLCGRRYFIILDDMWKVDAWDKIRNFLPRNETGSRIIVTTRILTVARHLSNSYLLQMSLLDGDNSWDLFCKIVFSKNGCPYELRAAAKKITEGCKGLPLSIVVMGGLLRKSAYRQEYWDHIAENFRTQLNLMDDELCSSILYMSYNQLPLHLKPCFLYMGVFPEDEVIHVSMLIKLWVAEGFLKPIQGKSMEHVAQEYMRDLIDRNLVIVQKLGSTGNIKNCNVHDLLRELCIREAQMEGFFKVVKKTSPITDKLVENSNNNVIRIVISERLSGEVDNFSAYARWARSLLSISGEARSFNGLRLLRIWRTFDKDLYEEEEDLSLPENLSDLVNLRYVAVTAQGSSEFRHSICRFWNLQTLVVNQVWPNDRASQIWNMPLLRHVKFSELELPDPSSGFDSLMNGIWSLFLADATPTEYYNIIEDSMNQNNVVVLKDLQTLSKVKNFRFSEEVVKRIANVRKLIVIYNNLEENSDFRFQNVKRLAKLESFGFFFFPSGPKLFRKLTFPNSLKKLTISQFHWEEMLDKIGSLPLLEKLKLINGHMKQRTWKTTEGQFCNLKFLRIDGCNVEWWNTESDHFPRLKHLVLELKAIPSEIGDIPTLESIRLEFCRTSSVVSARKILKDQQEDGNMDIRVRVLVKEGNWRPGGPAIPNFQVEYIPNPN